MAGAARLMTGQSLTARVMRSASWLVIGYGGSQALRLASNLILTRLLFPEAFGMMALVQVVLTGLMLFSDVGTGAAIAQNKRGDDPDFLDTAWTIQVARGFLLWGLTGLLAWPAAQFYSVPELLWYLPIAGAGLAIGGFSPTRIDTANRHLLMGRVTVLDLASQFAGISAMVLLAAITQSVLALVIGGVFQAAVKLALMHWGLPGHRNRLRWEPGAAEDLIRFGKWIFLSTACFFLTSQGDRAILGRFVPLDVLGIYNIGYFLASFPMLLGLAVNQRLMIPVYRDRPAAAGPDNRRIQRRLRCALTSGILTLLVGMALAGPWLVEMLFDDRYIQAGSIVVLIALAQAPAVIGLTYDQAALAAGDSRSFFFYSAVKAVLQTSLFLAGVLWFGVPGGIAALCLSMLAAYPALVILARKHHVWDALHDLGFALLWIAGGALALHLHRDLLQALAGGF